MLATKTLTEFADELASDSPAPGGGSAAAQAGANAAALVAMVGRLSVDRDGVAAGRQELVAAIDEADDLRARLLELVDEDTAAYEAVVATFRLPTGTEEEKSARRQAIQAATVHAARVPLDTMRACRRVIDLAAVLVGRSNPVAASDLGVAVQLARTGLEGGGLNVAINLGSLHGNEAAPALVAGYHTELTAGRTTSNEAAAAIDEALRPGGAAAGF